MTGRRATSVVPFSPDAMFDLVADVRRYPEFVPHCRALRVIAEDAPEGVGTLDAEMIVAYRAFRERFKCRVTLDRPQGAIDVAYIEGPFRKLATQWRFLPHAEGSVVDFFVDFEFRSLLLQATAAAVFERAFVKMSDAFVERAHAIYANT